MLKKIQKREKWIARVLFITFYLEFCGIIISYGQGSGYYEYGFKNTESSLLWNGVGGSDNHHPQPDGGESSFQHQPMPVQERNSDMDIDGPGQPEMGAFKAAGTSDMVDLFTGDFSYNIPLMDVGGYPVNIHYSSGVSMDQEASWVGLGWNINPGTIGRSLRGIPDDFNGKDSITKVQSIKENKTVGATVGGNIEILGTPIGIGARLGLFHNNYRGWGIESGINATINAGHHAKGPLSGSLGVSNNSQTGLNISPSLSVNIGSQNASINGGATIGSNYNSRSGIAGLQLSMEVRKNYTNELTNRSSSMGLGISSYMSFATPSYTPTITMPLTNKQFAFTGKLGGEVWGTYGNVFVEGYVTTQKIDEADKVQKLPGYGYLHFSRARGTKALLDFNREKDIPFNHKTTPHIAVPSYTYDLFTLSGEGTGGMFRPYRGDIGFVHDHRVRTNSDDDKVSGDFGPGTLLHVGVDYSNTTAITKTDNWSLQNDLLDKVRFQQSDSTFEEVYFRNPGEKAINPKSFYEQVGGDSLIRATLSGSGTNVRAAAGFTKFHNARPYQKVTIAKPIRRAERDKRTQLIHYLNAAEAKVLGLDPEIKSFKKDTNHILACIDAYDIIPRVDDQLRKEHHLSEIKVLNADGRRYVYGLPVYNRVQEDVTFSVNKETNTGNLDRGLTQYQAGDNSVSNNKGKDNFFNKEITPAYAHSFLLTGLLSPDYVDVTGNGISEDDIGDGIKFNYTQVYGAGNGYYKWRTPHDQNMANYNEGLKTYSRDDKATYIYGEKEVWYLHSLESKTMVALFRISDRQDAMSVMDENGQLDASKKLKKLDSIQLFVKSDLAKNGTGAKPVKTVHFEYNYELCQQLRGAGTEGKLTLKKIWFTYNGNNKGQLNPYRFFYHPGTDGSTPVAASNPDYNAKKYDRWGNYKNPADNPAGLSNLDFPYALQDSTKASVNSAVWHLTDIRIPSGGRLKITYESDDYAFVQNKRAAQMVQVTGFGETPASVPVKFLFNASNLNEYTVVFFDSPTELANRQEVWERYLEGVSKIYFKLAVMMPADRWGSGFEFVPTYGDVEDYGVVAGNNTRFWVKLKENDGRSPLAQAAIQFLRLNLPSKAYPASELGDNLTAASAVKMLVSGFQEIKNSVQGFDNTVKKKGWCRETLTGVSFARLNAPTHKKLGGGNRVKRIELSDNWANMTKRGATPGMRESVYGQEYIYEATREINGKIIAISSGVATYEPMLGNEENPFRQPIEYTEKVAPLAPANNAYTETPLGESFYPSAMVGYSKVRVRTINAKAKSANGWQETRFYTSRDFPTRVEFTPLDGESKKRHNPKLRNFLRINAKHYITVSQGFKVELNDMNGKMRSQAFYPENDPGNAISYTENFYKTKSERSIDKKLDNNVWTLDSANGRINTMGQIGKEVEVMVDFREQVSTTASTSISGNIDIIPGFPFIIPLPSKLNLPQFEEDRFRSVAVMKVVQQYGILDSIVVIDKGSVVSTKNIVYDGETGNVLLSRTNNEFDDPVYNFNYPAHWAYSGMGLAYKNQDMILMGKRFVDGVMVISNGIRDQQEELFESGDEIYATGFVRTGTSSPANGNDCPENVFSTTATSQRIWAVDAKKGKQQFSGIYFIDEKGVPYSANAVSLKVIRSGHRNMTNASVGSVVSLANPVRELSTGDFRIVFDTLSRVLNTGATVFSDVWKVENSYYEADSCYTVFRTVANSIHYPEQQAANFRDIYIRKRHTPPVPGNIFSSQFAASSYKRNLGNRNNHIRYNVKSVIRFDLSSIPTSATVNYATINLQGGAPRDIWLGVNENRVENFKTRTYAHYQNGDMNGRSNASRLLEVRGPWSISQTPYYALPTGNIIANLGTQPDESCEGKTSIVTGYVQNIVSNPLLNYGMAIDLVDQTTGRTEDNSSDRTVSYCAPGAHSSSFSAFAVPLGCTTCSFPGYLSVNYSYYKDTCVKVCRTYISDTATNPYRWGIAGNWRPERNYVYYQDRKEWNASNAATNIREEGELKDFLPFWAFQNPHLKATDDSSRWVWNQITTTFNRKGFEIENADPLGRFNSALYGYNQSLPLAVAQNAKAREILFDSFEDYGFKTQVCEEPCQSPREIDFLKDSPNASLQQTVSHSGRYSLFVNPSATASFQVGITPPEQDTVRTRFDIQVDSTPIYLTTVTGKGTGLTASYSCLFGSPNTVSRVEGPLNYDYDYVSGLPVCSGFTLLRSYKAEWTGKLQPRYTDDYTFTISSGSTIAGLTIGNTAVIAPGSNGGTRTSAKIRLQAGQLYNIRIVYPMFRTSTGSIQLSWTSTQHQATEIIPKEYLYPASMTAADTLGSVRRDIRYYCVALNNAKSENAIRPYFSPIQGSKMLVSAWVNTNPLQCVDTEDTAPANGEVRISFNNGTPALVTLQATGMPIEGWQRMEAVVDIPATATQMSLILAGASGYGSYFDDIRVQPYHSQMKGYVYDPVSLRLMAQLDENNYASFYEYDDDGTLIRTKKETVRGIQTISETRSALFKED